MIRYKISMLAIVLTGLVTASCFNDLNTEPLNKRVSTSSSVFKDPASYKEFLAKLYGSLTLTGQRGKYGQPEIPNSDEGETSFMRMYWSAQEIPTDECMGAWANTGVIELRSANWSEQNPYNQLLYQRIFINIAYCNEYIREVSSRVDGLATDVKNDVQLYLLEARFLRALYYYYAMDLWGNVPFATEDDAIGAFLPKRILRADLFTYIEGELKAIESQMAAPGSNEYARADQAAAWMLLARLYLNAKVYTGTERNTDCITYCNKITSSNAFSLHTNYDELFLADNDRLRNEIILPIAEDGAATQNYGGVTFIIHAAVGTDAAMNPAPFGIGGGWAGNRFRNSFVQKFTDITGNTDTRANFFTTDRTAEITSENEFTQGYACTKYKNVTSTGAPGHDADKIFVDTDFPLFRLPEVYLMYAEAVKRGGQGGDIATAVNYINALRVRAYGDTSGNITAGDLDLSFILDERARELYWEAHRRTDLIRYDLFAGNTYLWDWKGGAKAGKSVDAHFNLFPIPATDLAINTNLKQNDGY
ncbi:MAG TPA: RagB/SusD family nutrient uptake outer membrane protein [Cyclobacteriaceae bacterium]|nr:RagB/SusD family nutrient uptake outer membrane protein [Cyclobacteriaceae bacterium]